MAYETIRVSVKGAVATVTVHRPEKLNALNEAVIDELAAAFAAMRDVRVCVLTGAGDKAFVAGADIAVMAGYGVAEAECFARKVHALGRQMEDAEFPIVAAVNGFALGGGTELSLACDLIVASDRARFGQPEVGIGVIPGFGGTQRLARRVGVGKARELVYVGQVIDAAEALAMGLADRVVPHAKLMDEVNALAGKIAANAPLAVKHAKRVLHAGENLSMAAACELEIAAFALCFATNDQKTGMQGFLDNPRAPRVFTGR